MDGEVLAKQRGVMRVNCMDCLGEDLVAEGGLIIVDIGLLEQIERM